MEIPVPSKAILALSHKSIVAASNSSLASEGGIEVLGVTFLVQEVLLGVGFVLAAFGTLALILFRDVAMVQSSQNLTAQAWSNWRKKSRAAGYTLVFLGATNLAMVHVIMHVLSGVMTFCEGLFWRSLATLIVSILGSWMIGIDLLVDFDVFQWICLPCLLHCTSILLVFVGLTSLPASEATTLYSTYPFWALVFTMSIVREPVAAMSVAGIIGAFVGTLLIVQPFQFLEGSLDWAHSASALLTVAGAVLTGMLAITIRRMGVRVHYMMLSAWMSLYGIGLSLTLPLIQGKGPLLFDGVFESYAEQSSYLLICLALFMVCSCVSLLSLNWALQLENAGSISMVQVAILISFQWILDISMGSGASNGMSIAGILLVLLSCFIIYISKTGVSSKLVFGFKQWQLAALYLENYLRNYTTTTIMIAKCFPCSIGWTDIVMQELKEFDGDYAQIDAQRPIPDLLPAPAMARSALVYGERYET